MKVSRVKISDDATRRLRYLKSRTGLTPNILLRVGFGISLREESVIFPDKYPEDGQELNRHTITGELDVAFVALLREWLAIQKKPLDNATVVQYFRAHLNRGAMLLQKRVKSLTDLALLD